MSLSPCVRASLGRVWGSVGLEEPDAPTLVGELEAPGPPHGSFFFFKGYGHPRDLPSSPTRRSSDLNSRPDPQATSMPRAVDIAPANTDRTARWPSRSSSLQAHKKGSAPAACQKARDACAAADSKIGRAHV